MSTTKDSRKLKLKKLSQEKSTSMGRRLKMLTKLAQVGTGVGFQSGQITSELFSQAPKPTKISYERGPISISGSRDGRTYYYNPNQGQNVFYIVNSPVRGEAGKHVENFSDLYFQLLQGGVGQGMEQAKSQYESFLEEDPNLKTKIVEKIERDKKNIEEGRKAAERAKAEKDKKEGGEASPQATEQPGTQTAVARGEGSRERRARPTPIARGTSTYTGPNDPESIKGIIRKEFTAAGFPIELAEAAIVNAKKESNLNDPRYMVGDGGNSVGLFQLNIKGAGNWIIERDENGRVIYDPRMDPVQNTRGIIAELKSRINQGANGFPSIREALDRKASVAELAGLFCYHIERPANRIGDSNARAIEAMKTSPAPSNNMFGVPYNPASLKSGAQKLFPMKEMAAPSANVAAPVTAGDSSLDRLIKIASIQMDLGNQDVFEDAIISLAKSKNVPTNKKLWERAKAAAKAKFDIYPSAYGNAWASRWYKSKGGGWRKVKKNKAEDQMSVGALSKLTDDSGWLKEDMQEMKESEVPEWVEYLISQVARDMSHVMDYMKHRNESDGKMYVAQLSMVNKAAEELRDIMNVLSEEEIPEWVESLISDMASDLGHVKDYMEHGHHHKKASKLFDPLYYFEIKWKDYIDNGFFLTKEAVYRDSGLGRWFKEKWVDISRKTKSGKYAPCGRSNAKPGAYPKCRPSKRVTKQTPKTTGEMSSKEEKSAISQKRRKQRKRKIDTKGQKPIVDSHLKKD